jgi:hypothetical protein
MDTDSEQRVTKLGLPLGRNMEEIDVPITPQCLIEWRLDRGTCDEETLLRTKAWCNDIRVVLDGSLDKKWRDRSNRLGSLPLRT